jgi:DNA-binding NarL/FixJ family response regulator
MSSSSAHRAPSRALLLDDASFERSPLLAALAAEGVRTTRLPAMTDLAALTADSGPFAASPPDVVLLALDVEGIALGEARAKELLAHPLLETVPLLLITSSDVDPTRLGRLLAEGAFDYLDAGFGVPILRSRIQAALRWGKRMRSSADAPDRSGEHSLPSLPPVPLTQRTLRVTGAIVRGVRRTGASFDVALDDLGRMTLFAFHSAWSEADAPIRSFAVRRAVREALDLGRPLDAVAADALATLRSFSAATAASADEPSTMGLALLRFSADATTLEVLDCGFAPMFELRTDGTLLPLAQPSGRLGTEESPRFSASMVPVEIGNLYFVTSAQAVNQVDETLRTLLASLGTARPVALASMSETELRDAWGDAIGVVSGESPETDVVVLVAASDPSHVSSLRP